MDVKYSDFCRRPTEVFAALERGETINLLYRGKLKGQIVKPEAVKKRRSVTEDPLFGYRKGDTEPVENIIRRLRKPRYDL